MEKDERSGLSSTSDDAAVTPFSFSSAALSTTSKGSSTRSESATKAKNLLGQTIADPSNDDENDFSELVAGGSILWTRGEDRERTVGQYEDEFVSSSPKESLASTFTFGGLTSTKDDVGGSFRPVFPQLGPASLGSDAESLSALDNSTPNLFFTFDGAASPPPIAGKFRTPENSIKLGNQSVMNGAFGTVSSADGSSTSSSSTPSAQVPRSPREGESSRVSSSSTIKPTIYIEREYGSVWNYRFQLISALPNDDIRKWDRYQKLNQDFASAAETYGRVIISEFDPKIDPTKPESSQPSIQRMAIKPDLDTGGAAGGLKTKVAGILFKFARDWQDIYAGDEWAMKAAKLEHKAIRCVEWADIPNLHYPLFALVHYNGFTLIAQAILPLKKLKQGQKGTPTLVYGSDDGGKSFVNEDPEAAAIMERLGKKLNLRGHTLSSDTSFRHYGPLDVEIHRANGKYYIIDIARLMPCEGAFRHGEKGAHLAFHLRPTFLQKLAEKGIFLTSDLFTRMMERYSVRRTQMEADLQKEHLNAVTDLLNLSVSSILGFTDIPEFFEEIEDPLAKFSGASHPSTSSATPISVMLFNIHQFGLNYRHFGIIVARALRYLSDPSLLLSEFSRRSLKLLIDTLVLEGVARTIKNKAWEELRIRRMESKNPLYSSSSDLHFGLYSYIQQLFQVNLTDTGSEAWKKLHEDVNRRFPHLLDDVRSDMLWSTFDGSSWETLWKRFSVLSGVQLSERVLSPDSKGDQFFENDILAINPRTIMMGVLEMAAALSIASHASVVAVKTFKERSAAVGKVLVKLYLDCLGRLRKYFQSAPLISEESRRIYRFARGQVYFYAGLLYHEEDSASSKMDEAAKWYKKAGDLGHPAAFYNLSQLYYRGQGVEKDYQKTYELLSRAARRRYVPAQLYLAKMLENGVGIPKDVTAAKGWYSKVIRSQSDATKDMESDDFAAVLKFTEEQTKRHQVDAFYHLGRIYEREENFAKAIELYRKAANAGVKDAEYAMGWITERQLAKGDADKLFEAFLWYEHAAQSYAGERGHAEAQFRLARVYEKGIAGDRVKVNYDQAFKYYELSVQGGLVYPLCNIGRMYEKGWISGGVEKAIAKYKEAAARGVPEACEKLATMYENGIGGVTKSHEEAKKWHNRWRELQAKPQLSSSSASVSTALFPSIASPSSPASPAPSSVSSSFSSSSTSPSIYSNPYGTQKR